MQTQDIDPFGADWPGNFWRPSLADEVPLADVVADGTTAVAYGVRGDVLYIMDVYEVEASNPIPHNSSRTFRPLYLARPVSLWPIILATTIATAACATLIAWFVSAAMKGHS